ncbi:MAG TPA: M18 family aminopeptidase, partial [Cryobacterium sp.]|nr:M18 family aminopeptidase [Cryobacterium sp.]
MTFTPDYIDDFADFITASPSSYHAAAEVARRLDAAGFTRVSETDEWPSEAGRRYTVRDGAVIAWVQPEGAHPTTPFRILGAHTDSPGFKLKPKPTIGAHGWLQAGVEVYGGPLLNSWLDRELEFAGRLTTVDGTEHLVRTGPFCRIPQRAIHLDRDANTALTLDRQRHLTPVFGVGEKSQADLIGHLAGLAGLAGEDVAGYDIITADTAKPARFGLGNELFAAGRMDNLSSVYAGLVALLGAPES